MLQAMTVHSKHRCCKGTSADEHENVEHHELNVPSCPSNQARGCHGTGSHAPHAVDRAAQGPQAEVPRGHSTGTRAPDHRPTADSALPPQFHRWGTCRRAGSWSWTTSGTRPRRHEDARPADLNCARRLTRDRELMRAPSCKPSGLSNGQDSYCGMRSGKHTQLWTTSQRRACGQRSHETYLLVLWQDRPCPGRVEQPPVWRLRQDQRPVQHAGTRCTPLRDPGPTPARIQDALIHIRWMPRELVRVRTTTRTFRRSTREQLQWSC
jgi:hypothetical protein